MKQSNRDRVDELIAESLEFLSKGVEFAAEQAPLVVQEFLVWHFWYYTIGFFLWSSYFVLFGLYFWCNHRYWKKHDPDNRWPESRECSTWGPLIVGSLSGIFVFIAMILCAINVLKITIAPRLYLIEELPKLFGS